MRYTGMSVSDERTALNNITHRPDLLVSPSITAAGEFLALGITGGCSWRYSPSFPLRFHRRINADYSAGS